MYRIQSIRLFSSETSQQLSILFENADHSTTPSETFNQYNELLNSISIELSQLSTFAERNRETLLNKGDVPPIPILKTNLYISNCDEIIFKKIDESPTLVKCPLFTDYYSHLEIRIDSLFLLDPIYKLLSRRQIISIEKIDNRKEDCYFGIIKKTDHCVPYKQNACSIEDLLLAFSQTIVDDYEYCDDVIPLHWLGDYILIDDKSMTSMTSRQIQEKYPTDTNILNFYVSKIQLIYNRLNLLNYHVAHRETSILVDQFNILFNVCIFKNGKYKIEEVAEFNSLDTCVSFYHQNVQKESHRFYDDEITIFNIDVYFNKLIREITIEYNENKHLLPITTFNSIVDILQEFSIVNMEFNCQNDFSIFIKNLGDDVYEDYMIYNRIINNEKQARLKVIEESVNIPKGKIKIHLQFLNYKICEWTFFELKHNKKLYSDQDIFTRKSRTFPFVKKESIENIGHHLIHKHNTIQKPIRDPIKKESHNAINNKPSDKLVNKDEASNLLEIWTDETTVIYPEILFIINIIRRKLSIIVNEITSIIFNLNFNNLFFNVGKVLSQIISDNEGRYELISHFQSRFRKVGYFFKKLHNLVDNNICSMNRLDNLVNCGRKISTSGVNDFRWVINI